MVDSTRPDKSWWWGGIWGVWWVCTRKSDTRGPVLREVNQLLFGYHGDGEARKSGISLGSITCFHSSLPLSLSVSPQDVIKTFFFLCVCVCVCECVRESGRKRVSSSLLYFCISFCSLPLSSPGVNSGCVDVGCCNYYLKALGCSVLCLVEADALQESELEGLSQMCVCVCVCVLPPSHMCMCL